MTTIPIHVFRFSIPSVGLSGCTASRSLKSRLSSVASLFLKLIQFSPGVCAVAGLLLSTASLAAQVEPRNAHEVQAWQIYREYKESREAERAANRKLGQVSRDVRDGSMSTIGVFGSDPQDRADLVLLRQTVDNERQRQRTLLDRWGQKFYWRYGDLVWSEDKALDGSGMDRIEFALRHFPFIPEAKPSPGPNAGSVVGRLPPVSEESYNSMILDYTISGCALQEPAYSDNWTRSHTYQGKLSPGIEGILRVTGRAQWLTYPGPETPFQWRVTVTVTAGNRKKGTTYHPKTKSQDFDFSVPIGDAQEGSFFIEMVRSSSAGERNMRASGTMTGRAGSGSGNPPSTSVTGAAISEQRARELAGKEMADAQALQRDQIFYTGNDGGVANGGKPPTFGLKTATNIHFIMTYHYNNGQGAPAGTIALRSSNGKVYGPWQATSLNKVYWIVSPLVQLPPGSYEVIDSDPATWSQNGPNRYGHVLIKGTP
jgi:hypothetical protein